MFDNITLDEAKNLLNKVNKLVNSYMNDEDADAREEMIEVWRVLDTKKKELKKQQAPLA